jgi:hypothetical protein
MSLEVKKNYTCIKELTLQFEKKKLFVRVFWFFSTGFIVSFRFCHGRLGNFKFLNIIKEKVADTCMVAALFKWRLRDHVVPKVQLPPWCWEWCVVLFPPFLLPCNDYFAFIS